VRLPATFRTTPFRLTLLFLGLFAAAAAAFLFYIYAVTAGEVTRRADREIMREMQSLETVYRQGGVDALNQSLIERSVGERPFLYLLMDPSGKRISGTIAISPVTDFNGQEAAAEFKLTETDANGAEVKWTRGRLAAVRCGCPAARCCLSAPMSANRSPTSSRSFAPCGAPAR
jgi:hypothetical protein